jgi:hypothetical protein
LILETLSLFRKFVRWISPVKTAFIINNMEKITGNSMCNLYCMYFLCGKQVQTAVRLGWPVSSARLSEAASLVLRHKLELSSAELSDSSQLGLSSAVLPGCQHCGPKEAAATNKHCSRRGEKVPSVP